MYDASEPRNRRSDTIITFKSPEWSKSPPPPPEIEHEGVETQSSKAISAATRRRGNADARGVISGAGLSMAKKRGDRVEGRVRHGCRELERREDLGFPPPWPQLRLLAVLARYAGRSFGPVQTWWTRSRINSPSKASDYRNGPNPARKGGYTSYKIGPELMQQKPGMNSEAHR